MSQKSSEIVVHVPRYDEYLAHPNCGSSLKALATSYWLVGGLEMWRKPFQDELTRLSSSADPDFEGNRHLVCILRMSASDDFVRFPSSEDLQRNRLAGRLTRALARSSP
jgi:hypothetical protein